jgi:hypothetical protein
LNINKNSELNLANQVPLPSEPNLELKKEPSIKKIESSHDLQEKQEMIQQID